MGLSIQRVRDQARVAKARHFAENFDVSQSNVMPVKAGIQYTLNYSNMLSLIHSGCKDRGIGIRW